jgi:molybdenum cofactor guanylyltransferase
MGSDKAFLKLKGRPFILLVTEELAKVSDDIIVVIGKKEILRFKTVLESDVTIMKDSHNVGSPASGILTAIDHVRHRLTAIVACDLPLLKAQVIELLRDSCKNHSGAVPKWPNGDIEPLCSVLNVRQAKRALLSSTFKFGKIGPRHIIKQMKDVNYVSVEKLEKCDKKLESLVNVNSRKDYLSVEKRVERDQCSL